MIHTQSSKYRYDPKLSNLPRTRLKHLTSSIGHSDRVVAWLVPILGVSRGEMFQKPSRRILEDAKNRAIYVEIRGTKHRDPHDDGKGRLLLFPDVIVQGFVFGYLHQRILKQSYCLGRRWKSPTCIGSFGSFLPSVPETQMEVPVNEGLAMLLNPYRV